MTTSQTQLRLRIYSSSQVSVTELIEDLAESCRVVVRAIARNGQLTTFSVSSLSQSPVVEVELSGPLHAVQCWLKQLQKYPITIQGKGHVNGDSWYY